MAWLAAFCLRGVLLRLYAASARLHPCRPHSTSQEFCLTWLHLAGIWADVLRSLIVSARHPAVGPLDASADIPSNWLDDVCLWHGPYGLHALGAGFCTLGLRHILARTSVLGLGTLCLWNVVPRATAPSVGLHPPGPHHATARTLLNRP